MKPAKFRLHQPNEFEIERERDGAESGKRREMNAHTPNRRGARRQPHSVPAKHSHTNWDMPTTATTQQKRNEPYNWQEVLQTLPVSTGTSAATPKKHNHVLSGQRSQSQSATKPRTNKQQQRPRTNSLNEGGLNWQQMQLTKNYNKSTTPSKSQNIRKNLQQTQHRQKSDTAIIMLDDSAYAGAAFHNSPAPNELPAPQFLK